MKLSTFISGFALVTIATPTLAHRDRVKKLGQCTPELEGIRKCCTSSPLAMSLSNSHRMLIKCATHQWGQPRWLNLTKSLAVILGSGKIWRLVVKDVGISLSQKRRREADNDIGLISRRHGEWIPYCLDRCPGPAGLHCDYEG